MTIFIKVVKALVVKCLDNLVAASNTKDSGWFPRNTDLSESQIQIVNKLRGEIDGYDNSGRTDKDALIELKNKIIDAVDNITNIRKNSGYEAEGETKKGLLKINTNLDMFLRETEKKQHSFGFLDVVHDRTALNIFAFHSLYYFGQDIFIPHEESKAKKMAYTFFVDTNSAEIRQEKEKILFDNLVACQMKLNTMRDGEEFDEIRNLHVIESIEKVQRENTKFCTSKKIGTEIPVTATFGSVVNLGAPTFKPSRGRLEEAMEDALTDINARFFVPAKRM